jgi:ADP-ribose pyrophosphatase YjhB (NUDIX family)
MYFNQKIKKFYYFFKNPIYKFYCFIFRPVSLGVKVVVENNGKVLMGRISYAHKKWIFPGGGVEKGETFLQAASRELEEEMGIKSKNLVEMGEYTSDRNFKKNIVKCFYLNTDSSLVKIDNFEITESGWYEIGNLPNDCSPSVLKILEIYKNFKNK